MSLPKIQDPQFEAGIAALALFIKAAANTATAKMIPIYSGAGVPTDVIGRPGMYLRTDPADVNTFLYLTFDGTTWNALEADQGAAAIADTNTYFTTDTMDGAFDALALQLGGLTDATFGFAENNVLADDDAVYAALEKLDLKWGDLASVANGEGAALVGLEDAGDYLAATDVEAAIAEIAVTSIRKNVAESGTGVVLTSEVPGVKKVTLTLTNTPVVLVDNPGTVAYGGLLIATLPQGAMMFLGATADLALTLSAAGVNADWDGDFGLGTVTATNDAGPLAGTEQDLIPNTATPQAVGSATTATGQSTATEAPIIHDGTTTPIPVFLNFLVDDADHDVTSTPTNILCNGTITLLYADMGDY